MAENDRLYKCNISDFAGFCLKLEDKEFSKNSGLLNKKISGSLELSNEALLGEPLVLSPLKRIKRLIKNLIDFETVTPAQELRGNRIKKGLKLFFRKLKGGKICQN
jgi:hypothetical protein